MGFGKIHGGAGPWLGQPGEPLAEYPLLAASVRAGEFTRGEGEMQRPRSTGAVAKLPTIAAVKLRGSALASRTRRGIRACVRFDDDAVIFESDAIDAELDVGEKK